VYCLIPQHCDISLFIHWFGHYYYYYYYYYPRYLFYAGYLHLYSWDKPCPYGTLCCNYSDV